MPPKSAEANGLLYRSIAQTAGLCKAFRRFFAKRLPRRPAKKQDPSDLAFRRIGRDARTRLVDILLGEGLPIGEAKERLQGVTPESPVVAERVARAVKKAIAKGVCKREDFPLLLHIDGILTEGRPAPSPIPPSRPTDFKKEEVRALRVFLDGEHGKRADFFISQAPW